MEVWQKICGSDAHGKMRYGCVPFDRTVVDPSVAIEPSLVAPLNLICDSGNSSAESVADRLAALTRLRQETARDARLSYGRCAHNGTVVGCFTNDGGWRLLLAEASHRQQMAVLDEHRSRLESPPPASIDIVMSIVEGVHAPRDLQPADLAPARLRLHRDVRVTTVVYAKNESFTGDRPVEVARKPGFVRRATPYNEKLRNAHAYFRHIVDHYDELADVTLFLKTNGVNVDDAIGMTHTAASGRFPFDSHPWLPLPRGSARWVGQAAGASSGFSATIDGGIVLGCTRCCARAAVCGRCRPRRPRTSTC